MTQPPDSGEPEPSDGQEPPAKPWAWEPQLPGEEAAEPPTVEEAAPDGLKMLERLRDRGLISAEEFAERSGASATAESPRAAPEALEASASDAPLPPAEEGGAAVAVGLLDADQIARLERLAGLRDRGVLSEAEFQDQRTRLLAPPPAAPAVAAPRAWAPPPPMPIDPAARDELRRQGLVFNKFPVWLAVLLDIFTFTVFGYIWINHWHGLMPKRRPDDPSTARAIGFLFIPLFNLYWVFESHLRLVTRLDEEFVAAGLADRIPRELVRWTIIIGLIPYITGAVLILGPVRTGIMQSKVNRLADVDAAWRASQQ